MRKTSGHMKTKSNMASGNSHASFVQEAFRKLSVDSHHLLDLKQEQEDAVICLLERRDVFAVMPTGYGKSFVFQLFAKAMEAKKVYEGRLSDTIVLVVCPLSSIIKDQVKEGLSIGLNCVALRDLKDIESVNSQIIFASAEEALNNDFQRVVGSCRFIRAGELPVSTDDSKFVALLISSKSLHKFLIFRAQELHTRLDKEDNFTK